MPVILDTVIMHETIEGGKRLTLHASWIEIKGQDLTNNYGGVPRRYRAITWSQMTAIIDVLHSRSRRALERSEKPDESTEVGRNILLWQVARHQLFGELI